MSDTHPQMSAPGNTASKKPTRRQQANQQPPKTRSPFLRHTLFQRPAIHQVLSTLISIGLRDAYQVGNVSLPTRLIHRIHWPYH